MSLLDLVTGGASSAALDAQDQAIKALANVKTPTLSELTLPELQQYATAAGMTPAQMQAFLQESNAYNDQKVDQSGTKAQQAALAQLAGVADAGAAGTPVEQAQVSQIMQDTGRNLAGQRGAIDQQMQARGVPPGLLAAALQQQEAGQGLQAANQGALQAQGQAYQQAVNAMAQGGQLGGQLQGQQNNQANAVSSAQNAMQQFNAANQQQASQVNAGNRQASNLYNTENANQVSRANTGLANDRTKYNAQLPQQMFQNSFQKASGQAGQFNNLAQTQNQQGQQTAGLIGSLVGSAAKMAAPVPPGASGAGATPPPMYNGGMVEPRCMDDGGMIPGHASVPGDSLENDRVPIMASPGEAVLPRSVVNDHMAEVMALLSRQPQGPAGGPVQEDMTPGSAESAPVAHPSDVATLLKAMRGMRGTR